MKKKIQSKQIRITSEHYKKLKMIAARRGESLSDTATAVIERGLAA